MVVVAGWGGGVKGVNLCVRQIYLAMGVKKGALQCIVPRDGGYSPFEQRGGGAVGGRRREIRRGGGGEVGRGDGGGGRGCVVLLPNPDGQCGNTGGQQESSRHRLQHGLKP